MNVISFITLLQNYPMVGVLLALIVFAIMFALKNVLIVFLSRDFENQKHSHLTH